MEWFKGGKTRRTLIDQVAQTSKQIVTVRASTDL